MHITSTAKSLANVGVSYHHWAYDTTHEYAHSYYKESLIKCGFQTITRLIKLPMEIHNAPTTKVLSNEDMSNYRWGHNATYEDAHTLHESLVECGRVSSVVFQNLGLGTTQSLPLRALVLTQAMQHVN